MNLIIFFYTNIYNIVIIINENTWKKSFLVLLDDKNRNKICKVKGIYNLKFGINFLQYIY
jgi:hypothetical protein